MRHGFEVRLPSLIQLLTAAFLVALPLPAFGHETDVKVPDPGFRPDSEYAPEFLEALDTTTIAVYPSLVRRADRTAHSFSSRDQIVALLNDGQHASATAANLRIDLGPVRGSSQWEFFVASMQRIGEKISARQPDTAYHLFMEFLLPVSDQEIFGIQCYVLTRNGENAFSFLLNSHHRIFVDARLFAENSSQTARNRLIDRATQVGVAAFLAQVEQFRERIAPGSTRAAGEIHESPIDETSSIFSFVGGDVGRGSAMDKSMSLMCECADVTLGKGYSFFRTEDPGDEGDRRMRFKITFYHEPPQGLPVLSVSEDLKFTAAPGAFVLDAWEWARYCAVWGIAREDGASTNVPDTRATTPGKRQPFKERLCKEAAEVEYPINELPMYGHAQKTAEQKRADQRYIGTMTRGGASREDAAEHAARLGWNHYYAADCPRAIRRFNQAWLLDPGNRNALWGFAVISLERGEIKEATRYFRMAIDNGPEDPALQRDYEHALAMLD